ncbi:hypothetical protein HanPSC8_Chr12g0521271 [Helianthus annuus]|nr:hypothetical protein HanHA89_Chr12g0468771 [Helianthus annuus]KAJ0862693.1 hypothetical protein HanPSC8_Chr12g0521271 [Helianthus annuus]
MGSNMLNQSMSSQVIWRTRNHQGQKYGPTVRQSSGRPIVIRFMRGPSIEGRNVPRAVRMRRSSSNTAVGAQNYHYPWSVKLDKSTVSLGGSECGSTSTVLTNVNYCQSHVGFDTHYRNEN